MIWCDVSFLFGRTLSSLGSILCNIKRIFMNHWCLFEVAYFLFLLATVAREEPRSVDISKIKYPSFLETDVILLSNCYFYFFVLRPTTGQVRHKAFLKMGPDAGPQPTRVRQNPKIPSAPDARKQNSKQLVKLYPVGCQLRYYTLSLFVTSCIRHTYACHSKHSKKEHS